MSKSTSALDQGQQYRDLAGVAVRCQLVYEALQANSPRTWWELLGDMDAALGAANLRRPPESPFADDLRTLQAALLIEQVPGHPESFRPVVSSV